MLNTTITEWKIQNIEISSLSLGRKEEELCKCLWQHRCSQATLCMRPRTNLPDLPKNPWLLPCSYCACIRDSLDALKTTLCERLGTDTSRFASEALDAPISLYASVEGSLNDVMTTVCQHPGTKMPCSVPASRNQKTLT